MTKTSKATAGVILALGLLAVLIPFQVFAFQVESRESIIVPSDQTIDNNLYALGQKVEVQGKIKGDLIALAQNINVSGEVEGDVMVLGQNINIDGTVHGSVRGAGEKMNVTGNIKNNLMFAGNILNLDPQAQVGWNALLAVQKGNIKGKIDRDLQGIASTINIPGEINRDIKLKLSKNENVSALNVTDQAVIGGNLFYKAPKEGNISSRADIKGEIGYSEYQIQRQDVWDWFQDFIISLFAALLIGIIIISLWRDKLNPRVSAMIKTPFPFLGWGVIFLIVTPIIGLILIFTSVGLPLALILLGLWGITLYVGRVIAAVAIGKKAVTRVSSNKDSLMTDMVVGVVIFWLLFSLPIIGWLFSLAAMCWGSGMLFSSFFLKNNSKNK